MPVYTDHDITRHAHIRSTHVNFTVRVGSNNYSVSNIDRDRVNVRKLKESDKWTTHIYKG